MSIEQIKDELEELITERAPHDQVQAKIVELCIFMDEHRIDEREFAIFTKTLMERDLDVLPYIITILGDPWSNLYFYACLAVKECAPLIFQRPELRSQFIGHISDGAESVRGRVLEASGRYGDADSIPVDVLIGCWGDEKYWIREMASTILRRWGGTTDQVLRKVQVYLLSNLEGIVLEDPAVGNGAGDHATRLLFSLYAENMFSREFPTRFRRERGELDPLDRDFLNFFEDLKIRYRQQGCGTECREKILKIIRYVAQFIEVPEGPWDEAIKELRDELGLAPTCWTCSHWRPQHVPLDELASYLQSEAYVEFCERHTYFLEDYPREALLAEGLLDDTTGKFRPAFDKMYRLKLMGFCVQQHTFTSAGDTSERYQQRAPELPFAPALFLLDVHGALDPPTLLWAKTDGLMRRVLDGWACGANRYGQEVGGNVWTATQLLKKAAIETRYVSRTKYDELHFVNEEDIYLLDYTDAPTDSISEIFRFGESLTYITDFEEDDAFAPERTTANLGWVLGQPERIYFRDFALLRIFNLYKEYDRI